MLHCPDASAVLPAFCLDHLGRTGRLGDRELASEKPAPLELPPLLESIVEDMPLLLESMVEEMPLLRESIVEESSGCERA